jgi:tight adherence protein B
LSVVVLLRPREPRRRRAADVGRAPEVGIKVRLGNLTQQANDLAERALERRGKRHALSEALIRAGIAIGHGEFVVLMIVAALGGLLLGSVLAGPLAGIVLAAATFLAFRAVVQHRTKRCRAKFGEQLAETLQMLSSGLRAGHSLPQAVGALGQEADPPTSEEFRDLREEHHGRGPLHRPRLAFVRVGRFRAEVGILLVRLDAQRRDVHIRSLTQGYDNAS